MADLILKGRFMLLKKIGYQLAAVSLAGLSLVNIAHAATIDAPISDPYENFNRHAYKLNDTLDRAILKPVAKVYKTILPWPVTKGISNFFGNLNDIPTTANDLLQAKFYQATSDAWRIVINSTVGLGGLVDVASKIGLEKHHEDLGLTFAHWGHRSSNYFVIPLFGPSTVRDTIARPINFFYLTVYPYINDTSFRNQLWLGSVVSDRADALAFDKVIKEASFDPYIFQRNAYLEYRRAQMTKGTPAGNTDTYVGEYSTR
jgi:phospholipid-binding lipoprotein MlaA